MTVLLKACFTIALLCTAELVIAAADGGASQSARSLMSYALEHIFLVIGVLVIAMATYFIYQSNLALIETQRLELLKAQGVDIEQLLADKEPTFTWDKIAHRLNDMVPVAKETTIDLGHDYDGIRELDNRLPPWWLGIMYGSMVFAVVYLFYYHGSNSEWSSEMEYIAEMELGEEIREDYLFKMANAVNENNVQQLLNAEAIAAGKELFDRNCIACHGSEGQGGIGPNMTDPYWIHGGGVRNIFKTIKYGVPEKGMIAWKSQMSPLHMQQLSSYIMTLQGTNPPNQKKAEGDLYEADDSDMLSQN